MEKPIQIQESNVSLFQVDLIFLWLIVDCGGSLWLMIDELMMFNDD